MFLVVFLSCLLACLVFAFLFFSLRFLSVMFFSLFLLCSVLFCSFVRSFVGALLCYFFLPVCLCVFRFSFFFHRFTYLVIPLACLLAYLPACLPACLAWLCFHFLRFAVLCFGMLWLAFCLARLLACLLVLLLSIAIKEALLHIMFTLRMPYSKVYDALPYQSSQ